MYFDLNFTIFFLIVQLTISQHCSDRCDRPLLNQGRPSLLMQRITWSGGFNAQVASNWTKWYMSINFVPVLLAILPVFYEDTFSPNEPCMPLVHAFPGGRFKNTYELLFLRALKFSYVNKIHIFQCMGKIFCVEFQRYPLKFHTKYRTHTLKDMIFMQFWNFKSS